MRKVALAALCGLILVSFAAFAGGDDEAATTGKMYEGVTISVVAHSGHHATPWYDEAPVLKEMYGLELNVIEVTPDELYSREMLELSQQTGAFDIIQYNSAWIGDFEPYIQTLDDYVAKDNDEIGYDDILPAFNQAQNLWGGKKMSVTVDGDTFLMYYRKDLFSDAGEQSAFRQKYGYDLPDPPETWAQVVDLAEFFTRKKGQQLAGKTLTKDFYGYSDQAKRGRVYYWYLFRFAPFNAPDPHYFDPATMKPMINSAGSVKALENMKTLLASAPPGVLSWEWDELYSAAMTDGTVCMWIHWTDEGRGFNNLAPLPVDNPPDPVLGITATPGVEVGGKVHHYTIVDSAWVASVVKDSKNPDAAYAVLKHMFGKGPVNLGYIMDPQIGWDPFRYSHFNSAEWRQQIPGIENYLELELKALESGYPMVKIPGAFEYNDVLDLNVSKYLAGDFPTAKAALDAVAQRWNELNEKFGVDKQKGFYAKMWQ
jgi:multiple sugar transport system substrate-binding protein